MSPVLFTLGDWDVQAYGLFIGLALVAGWLIAMAMSRRDRLPPEVVGSSYVLAAVSGVLAARAAWVLQHPQAYESWRSLVTLQAGTLAPFFGIACGLLVSALHLAAKRIPPTVAWDAGAPAFAVGMIFERIGALLAGSGVGKYAPDLPFSIRFPAGSEVFVEQRRTLGTLLSGSATESLPVHPTQIYGMILGGLALWLCIVVRKRRRFSGQVFLALAMFVVLTRAFVEEWFRADAPQPVLGPLNPGQVGAIVIALALAVVYRARSLRADRLRLWEGGRWSPVDPEARPSATRTKTGGKSRGKPRGDRS